LKRLIEEDPKVTIRELASRLNSSVGTVQRHLHAIGFIRFFTSLEARFKVPKLGNWVPHLLSAKNKQVRLRIATELRNRHELGLLLLDSIVTGDEKWVLYVNVIRRHQWVPKDGASPPTAKPGLQRRCCSLFFGTLKVSLRDHFSILILRNNSF
jgi:histone-lysine N-methyltransferase SETMAR